MAGIELSGVGVELVPDQNSGGTVTSVSVTTANGVSGVVATATTTPAITLTLGAITPTSVAIGGATLGSNVLAVSGATALTVGTNATALSVAGLQNNNATVTTASGGNAFNQNVFAATPSGTVTGTYSGIRGVVQYNSSSDTSGAVTGIQGIAELFGQGSANQVQGVYGIAQSDASGGAYTAGSLYGGRFQAIVNGTSTFSHVIGVKIDGPLINGNTTFASGLYVQAMATNIGTGVVTASDAIHIEGSGVANAIGFGNGSSTINATIYSSAANILNFGASGGSVFSGAVSTGAAIDVNASVSVPYKIQGASVIGRPGSSTTISLAPDAFWQRLDLYSNGGVVASATTTGFKINSGVSFWLGNSATTGLVAGVLAATTNASIVITDSAGQAYRIPCII